MDGQQWETPSNARSSSEALQALQAVYIENEALFYQSSMFIEQLYREGELSLGKRTILLLLLHKGPQTIPQIAHARSASRQYVQRVVKQLAKMAYVEFVKNEAHKRSYKVQLTEQGRAYLLEMLAREVKIVQAMVVDIPVEQLRETARMLRRIREWQRDELQRLFALEQDSAEM